MPGARAMTYAEREAFIDAGLDPMFTDQKITPQRERDIVGWMLKNIYQDCDFSGQPYPKCRNLAYRTYELTIKAEEDEVKNL
ncbi:hypothetical protein HSX37_05650|uniref:Uncharacterized protein n=1 Tax=Dendrosporobacter quercicolus TaxID=146817 RepID=A0A1G9P2M5_9FIRM|nr:hypothetical protein [Dendrosporobacter quercicolus]NSL47527.1 hypothetical protein [Dendrosporobacter quercicolus DSM 1736]SDL92919.1 hypothetical protein SAMN04488502_1011206 [Dendrosporobacter quercicolus]